MEIEYRSLATFELDYKADIYAHSETLIQDHLWWNEPFTLYDQISHPLHLTGKSNLIMDGLSDDFGIRRTIPRKDDVFMAIGDYLKIIAVLETLSTEHELTWHLFYKNSVSAEITIGMIENGKADEAIVQFAIDSLQRYDISLEAISDEHQRMTIYHKYFDANDQPILEEPIEE